MRARRRPAIPARGSASGRRTRTPAARLARPALTSSLLEQPLECPEVLRVGTAHGGPHEPSTQLREARRLAAVAECHVGAAAPGVAPGVRGLHREGALG